MVVERLQFKALVKSLRPPLKMREKFCDYDAFDIRQFQIIKELLKISSNNYEICCFKPKIKCWS